MTVTTGLLRGDCLTLIKDLPDNSVDSNVTDPPYELGFMGKSWDNSGIAYNTELWAECLRVLKPGGHLLAFGGSRTYHRLACAVEDAGFEIRDQIMWLHGQGFPKAARVSLKPAHEPIVVARKPLAGTVASNVLTYGTGALNIDGCRIGSSGARNNGRKVDSDIYGKFGPTERVDYNMGRWPKNVIHDGSDEVLAGFPNDAAQFFYCAKASKSERNAGLPAGERSTHPTVKPLALMRYLVRLVTPPGGVVLDPFLGSGTTAVAAILEGHEWIGCEMTDEYWPIIDARVRWANKQPKQLPGVTG